MNIPVNDYTHIYIHTLHVYAYMYKRIHKYMDTLHIYEYMYERVNPYVYTDIYINICIQGYSNEETRRVQPGAQPSRS